MNRPSWAKVSFVAGLGLAGFAIGHLEGMVMATAAAIIGWDQPRIVALCGALLIGACAVATVVEAPGDVAPNAVGGFVRARPWAAELGRAAGVLLIVAVVGGARLDRAEAATVGSTPVQIDRPPARHMRAPSRGDPTPLGLGVAAGALALALIGDRTLSVLVGPLLAIAALVVLVPRIVRRKVTTEQRSPTTRRSGAAAQGREASRK